MFNSQQNPSNDSGTVIAELPRAVRVLRGKQTTSIRVSCDVAGSVCFMRAGASGQGSHLVRLLKLTPPEPFGDGIVVFGLNGSILERLRRDDAFAEAVVALLKTGSRITLQNSQLTFTIGNSNASKSKEASSYYVGTVATRLETVAGAYVNDATGVDRIGRPYVAYAIGASLVYGVPLAFLESSLTPLTIVKYSFALGLVFAIAGGVFVIPTHLRNHALGGAAAFNAVISALICSIFIGSGLAMIANTYLGEKLLTAQLIRVVGTTVITRGKHMNCWLYLDRPSPTLVRGTTLTKLPLTCGEAHYRADPQSRVYDIKLNPGLLNAPFVQSIEAVDDASAY
ncbi:hypothetical protein P3T24_005089 [Paraburkholderia sp. GAS33]